MKRFASWSVRTLTRSVGGFVGGTAVAAVAVLLGIAADKRDRLTREQQNVLDGLCACGRCTDWFGDNE